LELLKMRILAWPLNFGELVLIGIVLVLIFGRRLPEVGRNLGRSLFEFKRGLKEAGDEFRDAEQAARDTHDAARSSGPADSARDTTAAGAAKPSADTQDKAAPKA
jgi:sec-independent protein translocase protein TatA